MLRDLASADARIILKGGVAMRVVVGSMRLTKHIKLVGGQVGQFDSP